MGSRLGRRVINFANLPVKLIMPNTFTNIQEFALKTIPSATKIEIKRVLESLYGFDVEKVQTLNVDGKKKKGGGQLYDRPDYKKAYITLRTPLSISENLFTTKVIQEERQSETKSKNIVEEEERKKHWLDEKKESADQGRGRVKGKEKKFKLPKPGPGDGEVKFPWSSMKKAK